MTLLEMSALYADSAALLRLRIAELRAQARAETDPVIVRQLQRRIDALVPIVREMRELAALTGHYYDRGCPNHEHYTL